MNKDDQERKKFLEEQIEWYKKQDAILEKIEIKLHEMKKIAQFTLDHKLAVIEIDQLNSRMKELESEIHFLKKQLHSVVH